VVRSRQGPALHLKTPFGDACIDLPAGFGHDAGRGEITLTIRPENLGLHPPGALGNAPLGKIISILYSGSHTHYDVQINGHVLKAFALNGGGGGKFQVGQEVGVTIPAAAWRPLQD